MRKLLRCMVRFRINRERMHLLSLDDYQTVRDCLAWSRDLVALHRMLACTLLLWHCLTLSIITADPRNVAVTERQCASHRTRRRSRKQL